MLHIGGHDLVLLDAPGLVEEDYRRHAAGKTFAGWEGARGGAVEFVKGLAAAAPAASGDAHEHGEVAPRILLTHIPLFHPEAGTCGPLREGKGAHGTLRRGVGRGWQNTLDKATTEFLLGALEPSAVFSGDDRDYCEYTHPVAKGRKVEGGVKEGKKEKAEGVREVTIKSFSLASNIHHPGFQLLALAPPPAHQHHAQHQHTNDTQKQKHTQHELARHHRTWADTSCALPDRRALLTRAYLPLVVLTALVLLLSNLVPRAAPLRLAPFAAPKLLSASPEGSAPGTPWGPLSPFTPFASSSGQSPFPAHPFAADKPRMNVRIPSTSSAASLRATVTSMHIGGGGGGGGMRSGSTSGTATPTPLLTPSASFHEEDGFANAQAAYDDEGDAFFPPQYALRGHRGHMEHREHHWPNGEHADEEDAADRGLALARGAGGGGRDFLREGPRAGARRGEAPGARAARVELPAHARALADLAELERQLRVRPRVPERVRVRGPRRRARAHAPEAGVGVDVLVRAARAAAAHDAPRADARVAAGAEGAVGRCVRRGLGAGADGAPARRGGRGARRAGRCAARAGAGGCGLVGRCAVCVLIGGCKDENAGEGNGPLFK